MKLKLRAGAREMKLGKKMEVKRSTSSENDCGRAIDDALPSRAATILRHGPSIIIAFLLSSKEIRRGF